MADGGKRRNHVIKLNQPFRMAEAEVDHIAAQLADELPLKLPLKLLLFQPCPLQGNKAPHGEPVKLVILDAQRDAREGEVFLPRGRPAYAPG